MKICGIYKITSPSGRVYIGQSKDIYKRWKNYKNESKTKQQIKLHHSIGKYGVENHIFEIVEECSFEQLNIRERYYQDFHNVLGKNGLNLRLTGTEINTPKFSEEVLEKMRNAFKGRIHSEESRKKISEGLKGIKRSVSTRKKISDKNKGKPPTFGMKGRNHSPNTKKKISKSKKGVKIRGKKIINTSTGKIFDRCYEAAREVGINRSTLSAMLIGQNPNTTTLIYLKDCDKWKESLTNQVSSL